ncbi:Cytochrome P450 [Mycena kentingensis (nom. inval.)]|nr:Cytochrome P450 [Mycena kentingensis (nom. inval.)]
MSHSELALGALLASGAVALVARTARRDRSLPPGPPTVPVLGNAHLLGNGKDLHLRLTQWAREYGDIYSVKLGSGTMIVLSSATAIKSIIDKNGWTGSSRVTNHVADLCGTSGDFNMLFAGDCPRLHNMRRIIGRFFSPQNTLKYQALQDAESVLLLNDLLERPLDFIKSIRRFTHSVAKVITYGQHAASFDDPKTQKYYALLDEVVHALAPGTYPPFELFPFLKHIPRPFAPWIDETARIAAERTQVHEELYADLAARLALDDEEAKECFMGQLIRGGTPPGQEAFYSYSGLMLLDGGSDTSGALLISLVLILAVFPECQERIRQEIYANVPEGRLPEASDMENLPYLDAFFREAVRFRPILPTAIPHAMSADVMYKGHVVPRDAMVVLNIHGIFHDPDVFENPHLFNPDRFLKSEHGTLPGMDADFRENLAFGAGRRVCPGQWIARSTVKLAAMRLVWAFTLSDARDYETKQPISRDLECYASDFVVMPRPFTCTIEPTNGASRDVVVQSLDDAHTFLRRFRK